MEAAGRPAAPPVPAAPPPAPRRVFLFFIDGFGIGPDDPAKNPVLAADLPTLEKLLGGRRPVLSGLAGLAEPILAEPATMVPADACLGVPGLPQSATGQTALFSGVNAPALLGRHLNAYPNEALSQVLKEKGLLRRAVDRGLRATFINAFTRFYTDLVESGGRQPSASTVTALGAGLPLRTVDDLLAGRAVYHDITNEWLIARGFEVPVIDPETAGRRAAAIARDHEVSMFEHFLTDFAGHAQDMDQAVMVLERIDHFLGAFLADFPLNDSLAVMASDHGNIEDLSVKTHTRNPVPVIAMGAGREALTACVAAITDVAPAMMSLLDSGLAGAGGGHTDGREEQTPAR
jgi:hypothetical protein